MNTLTIILGVLRLVDFIISRAQLSDAMKLAVAMELVKLNERVGNVEKIVKDAAILQEEQIDMELRG